MSGGVSDFRGGGVPDWIFSVSRGGGCLSSGGYLTRYSLCQGGGGSGYLTRNSLCQGGAGELQLDITRVQI